MKAQEQEGIKERYARVAGTLDERGRRAVVASEALALGRGGITAVARATGVSRKVITLGIKELHGTVPSAPPGRIRRPGGGRKKMVERDPSVQADLDRLVAPVTRGDPDSPLRWTCKSVRTLAAELGAQGHRVSHAWVAGVLREQGYRLQGHRKTRAGGDHPDRDAQFAHIRVPPSMPPEKGPLMNENPNDDHSRRRRLRLGALLFRLGYYMQVPDDIAAAIYRYSPDTYVQVVGTTVRLVAGQHEEIVDLEEAIVRCKAALTGAPLHRLG